MKGMGLAHQDKASLIRRVRLHRMAANSGVKAGLTKPGQASQNEACLHFMRPNIDSI